MSARFIVSEEIHSHEEHGNLWQQAWEVITDPPHAIGEIFYGLLFEIILVPVAVIVYRGFTKKRRLRAGVDYKRNSIKIEHDLGGRSQIELLLDESGNLVRVVETRSGGAGSK